MSHPGFTMRVTASRQLQPGGPTSGADHRRMAPISNNVYMLRETTMEQAMTTGWGRALARSGSVALAAAGAAEATAWPVVQLTEARSIAAPALGPQGPVCSGYDATVCADVSGLYRARRTQLAQVGAVLALTPQWGVRLRYTQGTSAAKATLRPRLLVGLIATQPLRTPRMLSFEVHATLGGQTIHRPCQDAYDRAYHCATLTAWADHPAQRVRPQAYGLRASLRF